MLLKVWYLVDFFSSYSLTFIFIECFLLLSFLSFPGALQYFGQSPDEGALVKAARTFGFVFQVSQL